MARRLFAALIVALSSLALDAQATTSITYYADNAFGDAGFDGMSAVITNGHGPKRYIADAINTASSGDQISVAAGYYQEFVWDTDSKIVTLVTSGQVAIVDFDPGQTDTDGDGIPDWWMLKYFGHATGQTNDQSCAACDADGDFVDNLAEFVGGDSPTNSASYPPISFTINGGTDVVTSTQLHIDLEPGLIANYVMISEDIAFSSPVTNTFSLAFNYTLADNVDGSHTLYLKLLNANGMVSDLAGRTVELDRNPPSVSITSPANGVVSNQRRIDIEGFAADASTTNAMQSEASRPLLVTVNGDFVNDRDTNGMWWAGLQDLVPGTNTFTAAATDRAGWSVTNSVWFIYDPTLATNVPVFTVDVTNTVTVGSNATSIAVSGTIDDDNAFVQVDVLDAEDNTITNASVSAAVHGTNWWAEVPVVDGRNLVVITAQNDNSLPATNGFTAIQDPNVSLEIASPAANSTVNSSNVTVVGLASANFNGTITINGQAALTSTGSGGITFSNSVPINNVDANIIEVHATGTDGSSATVRQIVYGYGIVAYHDRMYDHTAFVGGDDWVPQHYPDTAWFTQDYESSDTWAAPSAMVTYSDHGEVHSLSGALIDSDGHAWTNQWDPTSLPIPYSGWDRDIYYGDYKHVRVSWYTWWNYYFVDCDQYCDYQSGCCIDSTEQAQEDYVCHHELTFIKHWPTDEEQTVLLHFDGFTYYADTAHYQQDASQVRLWGQPGLVYSLTPSHPHWPTNIAFLVKIKTNTRYTLHDTDFTVPTLSADYTDHCGVFPVPNCQSAISENYTSQILWYGSFGNEVVQLSSAKAANSPTTFEFGKTDIADPCTDAAAKALVVYYKDVIDQNFQVKPFDVKLQLFPDNSATVTWSKHNGPDSGTLNNAGSTTATFSNPVKGGLYQFDLDYLNHTTRTQLWLPVAGPDISYYWNNEINYFKNTWGPAYQARLDQLTTSLPSFLRAVQKHRIALREMEVVGINLDWTGQVTGQQTPCGGPKNAPGNEWRHTLYGVVIDFRKRNNMMYALIGREMGLLETELKYSPDLLGYGSKDDQYVYAAYSGGFDLYNGQTLEAVMQARGHSMQVPGSWTQREWPSDETSQGGLTRKAAQQLETMIQ
jgi:hypothetical protein